jgi:hypothetical protein
VVAQFVQTDGKSWRVDATRWPVLIITRLSESIDDAELKRSLQACDAMVDERRTRYSVVLDNRLARNMSPTQRKLIADHMAVREQLTRSLCLGSAFVLDSAVMRGILTAVFWMHKPVVQTKVFAELDGAVQWAGMLHAALRSGRAAGRLSMRP